MEWPHKKSTISQVKLPGGYEVDLLRDDNLHPQISGNKWRKLKYNVLKADQKGYYQILTYGGAFSNHIAATAAAGKEFGFKTIGVIRGEYDPNNPTLQFAEKCGMHLHFVSRSAYREKDSKFFRSDLRKEFGPFFNVPEGGANFEGIQGCQEIWKDIDKEYDYVIVPCGTCSTMAGLILGNPNPDRTKVVGIPVLNVNDGLQADLNQKLFQVLYDWELVEEYKDDYLIFPDFHLGGYAKITSELKDFVETFKSENAIQLDYIYNGKMMFALSELIGNEIPENSKVLAVHTGGVQGNEGLRYMGKLQ
ncbi:1-aminocyclopropane-1-carboxylate deaminase/D-cysteine desulfhydrase [Salibacter halophilus]|uniref:1-aminocyclopropane-1-carboxylate deaminase/D-cysteine desulfhydrase n=1 Tax=Salibacter halophilus TaxID=1803916 RepID=UPI001478615C|nr:pyridoxal-phosphate dependent enzyme [Salibacter halophilus]